VAHNAKLAEGYARALLDSTTEAGIVVDAAGVILIVNSRAAHMLGYAPAELQGRPLEQLVPEGLRRSHAAHTAEYFGRPRARPMGVGISLRAVRKDGTELPVEISLTPIAAAAGALVLAALRAIGPREDWYRSMFEGLAIGVVHSDAAGAFLSVNQRFCDLLGYARTEVLALGIRRVTHPDDLGRSIDARACALAGTAAEYQVDARLLAKSGAVVWTHIVTSIVRHADAGTLHFISLVQDISGQRRAEEQLRESERRFRQVTDNIREVFWLTDRRTHEMLYVSPGYREIWGRSTEELYASPQLWLEAVHPEDRQRVMEAARGKQVAGDFDEEYRIVRPDGSVRWVRDRAFPVHAEDGEVIRIAGVAEDITDRRRSEEMRARMAAIVESSDDAIVGKTLDGLITSWNAGARKLFGYDAEEAVGRQITLILPPDRLDEEVQILERLRRGERVTHFETVRRRKDGSLIDVSLAISPILDSQGRIVGASKIARDITERKRAQTKIGHLNRVYAVLSSINSLIVRVRGQEELFRESCRIAVDVGSFRLAWIGIVDHTAARVTIVAWHGADEDYLERIPLGLERPGSPGAGLAGCAVAAGRAVISNDVSTDERFRLRAESAARGIRAAVYIPLSITGAVVGVLALYSGEAGFFDEAEMRLLLELAGDISFAMDHIDKANRVDYLAYYDPLTGLANRTLFLELLGQHMLVARAARGEVVLVLADVERLRTVNDSLGRQAGDSLLKLLAARLVAGVGQPARVAGDQFAFVAAGTGGRAGLERTLAETWHEVFGKPFEIGGSEISVSAKAGIAVFPTDGANAEALLSSAEGALRKAKETGETHVFHAPEMAARSAEKRTLETRLRRALEKEEFVLHYQPKLELQSRRIVGAEALLRWQSPDLGLVQPLKFIPLLEETGLILEVGAWALSRAARDHHRWIQRGISPPRVAVNVSPVQMRKKDFVDRVAAALTGGAVPPGIDLEITESLLMEDVGENMRKLSELRDRGVLSAIDDFGTGYSSLSYLAKLPVQALKIDRSFVLAMSDDPDTTTLVQTIISLAHSLNLKVIAEGVETEEQAKLLRLLRCDEVQGYLFSHPLPFEPFTALLEGGASAEPAAGDSPPPH
jgi:PAS domain S-box-containing protein/diguanylate cyclase (GGDEF)-like protein